MLSERVTSITPNKLYGDTKTFLESQTPNTKIAYESDLRDFFKIMRNKSLEEINLDDLRIRLADVERYRLILIDHGYEHTTINRKISAVRRFFRYLNANEYDVKYHFFKELKPLKQNPKSYGLLTPDEAYQLAETIRVTERDFRMTKYYLVLTAIFTSIRLNALLNLKWSDISPKDDLYIITAIDKGNEIVKRPITSKFYDELTSIKRDDSEHIFNLSAKSVQKMMQRVTEKMEIPKERNIKFHSLRAVGSHFVLDVTGDPKAAMRQSGHKSFDVWWNHYINKDDTDYSQMAGILMNQDIDLSILNKLSNEEVIGAIEKLSFKSKMELIHIINDIYKEKSVE